MTKIQNVDYQYFEFLNSTLHLIHHANKQNLSGKNKKYNTVPTFL
jgi:hypothetical protein